MIRPQHLIRGLRWLSAMALLGLPVALAQAPQSPSSQPQSSSAPAKGNSDSDFDVTPGQAPNSQAQPATGGGNTVLRTGSTLVLVPALVKTKKGWRIASWAWAKQ